MRVLCCWAGLLIVAGLLVEARPAGAAPTSMSIWQPPVPTVAPIGSDDPFLHYELRALPGGSVTVVEVSPYEATLRRPEGIPNDWHSHPTDPHHIQALLVQAESVPLRLHYAPLGTQPDIQQTLVYTQAREVKMITFDSTSSAPAPPVLWDLVAALRRAGALPPLSGRPTGSLPPPTISFSTAMEGYVLQIDSQGTARLYESWIFRAAKRLTPAELADIRAQVATAHFFDLDPFYTFADPPGGIVDADFLDVVVTQAGRSKVVSSRGGTGPPAFRTLLDTLYGLIVELNSECHTDAAGKLLVEYDASDGENNWLMGIDTNGGVHFDAGAQNTPSAYLDPASLATLEGHFQQAKFKELPGWYAAVAGAISDHPRTVEIWLEKDGYSKEVGATTGTQVPAGYQTILADLAGIYTQARQADQRPITNGICGQHISLNSAASPGPVYDLPPTGGSSDWAERLFVAGMVLLLTGLGILLVQLTSPRATGSRPPQ